MNDLLVLLGKRVQALRDAKGLSQETFADVSGLHRTYIGQVERGEKNISFKSLTTISTALGVTLSELLSDIEERADFKIPQSPQVKGIAVGNSGSTGRELRKLVRTLNQQRAAMHQTIQSLDELVSGSGGRQTSKRKGTKK